VLILSRMGKASAWQAGLKVSIMSRRVPNRDDLGGCTQRSVPIAMSGCILDCLALIVGSDVLGYGAFGPVTVLQDRAARLTQPTRCRVDIQQVRTASGVPSLDTWGPGSHLGRRQ